MLWYKAWIETRARFLTSLATLTFFCTIFVLHNERFVQPAPSTDFNRLLYVNQTYVAVIWTLAVVLLGMGGLVREKAMGTSPFTLALSVRRARFLCVRAGVGILEASCLGIVPWIAILIVAWFAKMPISISQVGSYVLLLVCGGLVYFEIAILVSSAVGGEYTAPALAIGLIFLGAILVDDWVRRFNFWRLITGDFLLNKKTYLLSGHLPWLGIFASLSVAALILLASAVVVEKSDF